MKKILVLASILLVLTLAFVACTEEKPPVETPGETVAATDPVTDAPVAPTEEPTAAPVEPTDAPTDAPVEPTDEPVAPTDEPAAPTDEPEVPTEEPETLPYVEPSAAGANGPGPCVDALGVNNTPVDKSAESLTIKTGETFTSVDLHGWVGFAQNIKAFGYFVNDGEFVYDEAFATILPEGDPVLDPANGGANAQRFNIYVPASALSVGENKVGFVVQLADDTVVILRSVLTVNYEKTNWNGSGIITHQSFDQLYFGTGDAVNGPENIFTPGASAQWDGIVNCDFTVDTLTYWGWIGVKGSIGQFGYQVNGGTAIYDDAWTVAAGDDVKNAAAGGGADDATRMKIAISLAGIGGEGNVITVLYKNAEGEAVVLGEFVVNRKIADYTVPQDQWVISGHRPGIQDSTDGMVAAGGVESGALLHQGSIYLGEIDLSKYSKVVIYWGCDNSEVTVNHYNASANNRIMLLNSEMVNVTTPADGTIIAGTTYELKGWAVTAIEIDLTGIDYNGPVYVAIDTLPGTFALFSEITFVGLSEDPNYEPEVQTVVIDPRTLPAGSITGHQPNIVDSSYADHFPMINAAGLTTGAMLHQGSIYIGEYDLTKIAKVVIYYATDWGDGTQAALAAAKEQGFGCLGLSAADCNNVVNPDRSIFIGEQYTPDGGWTITAHELPNVAASMYSGPVYVSADFVPGQFIIIDRIEIIFA